MTKSLGQIAGQRINYACAGSGVLLGFPTRSRTWTQAYANTVTAKTHHRVKLCAVWW